MVVFTILGGNVQPKVSESISFARILTQINMLTSGLATQAHLTCALARGSIVEYAGVFGCPLAQTSIDR